ncbi:MAG: hypothetical protein ABI443_13260 [Chthoniobacterales bacterium]
MKIVYERENLRNARLQPDFLSFRFLLAILLLPLLLNAQTLPVLKAQVSEPVIQEFMGGCSMKCAFPWQTFAIVPGKSPQPVYKLDDNDASTGWIDANISVGTKLQFQFPKKLPSDFRDTPFYGFDMASGVIKPLTMFKVYARVKKARLYFNGKAFADVAFSDSYRWQRVHFDDLMVNQGDTFTFEILEVYPGEKFPNAAITEFVLQGAH